MFVPKDRINRGTDITLIFSEAYYKTQKGFIKIWGNSTILRESRGGFLNKTMPRHAVWVTGLGTLVALEILKKNSL